MSHPAERQILGHPSGLFVLFFTELWERFNFYGMRALLIFYFMDTFAFNRTEASESYGEYNGLVYATPLLGGMLADKIIGYRRSIILGAILMGLGEFGLCFAGFGIIPKNSYTVFMSLALIIMGNGFFKPNISTLVGKLYRQATPAATVPSLSSTWASISASFWRRSSAARSVKSTVSIMDSGSPDSEWSSD